MQPSLPQRVREQDERQKTPTSPRRCSTRIALPDRTNAETIIFTCNCGPHFELPGHTTHRERGRVRLKDGRVVKYSFEWSDDGREVWRG
jgi:hypothetical protein